MNRKVVTPNVWTWVKAVGSRGFFSWNRYQGWITLAFYVAVLALGATWFFDEQIIGEQLQTWIAGIAVALLLFNLVVLSPFLLWKEGSEQRNSLLDVTDYESALNDLALMFDEANDDIFNSKTVTLKTLPQWHTQWKEWQTRVEEHLEKHFGLRERLMFHNQVLVQRLPLPHVNDDHLLWRSILAQQLETIRAIIVRYSDRVEKWRTSVSAADLSH